MKSRLSELLILCHGRRLVAQSMEAGGLPSDYWDQLNFSEAVGEAFDIISLAQTLATVPTKDAQSFRELVDLFPHSSTRSEFLTYCEKTAKFGAAAELDKLITSLSRVLSHC